MEFGPSPHQALLQDSLGQCLDRNAPLERVKQFADGNENRADDVWAELCEMDVPGLLIAEEHGGMGLGLLDAALVAETLGSNLAPTPYVATAVMVPLAIASAGSEEQQARWLPKLANGSVIAGAAVTEMVGSRMDAQVRHDGGSLNGRALFVLDFEADLYLVADDQRGLYLIEADAQGLERRSLTTVDKTRRVGELVFNNVAANPLPGARESDAGERIIDAGRIILAADTLGSAQSMLTRAVAYSKERVQFDRPIASFQAVKHMCAKMAAALEPCRAMMWYAAHAFDAIPDEARLTACHTKAHISEIGTFVARTATEVHGGIGFTHELGLHFWLKRIGANRQLLGGPDRIREEAAKLQELV